ncbi:TetR/AcrR family transcriptional regulator [Streptomyces venezuelae]|uniref:TetR/AcrR family transcriptional regulator n=1 Tax=Streptomyces venezuelae TaxID=54571 RepID=UPI00362F860A
MTARRPPNRKALIRAAAADLFQERGYHNVSLADVAEAVETTAPALYRHYRNKQDLLRQTVLESVTTIDALVRESSGLDGVLSALTTLGLERQNLVVLLEREARHLPEDDYALIRQQVRATLSHLAGAIGTARPELAEPDRLLIAQAVFGVYASPATHRTPLSRRRAEHLLLRLGYLAAHCEFATGPVYETPAAPSPQAPAGDHRPRLRVSRREQLLTEATRLFDERGFQSVSLADIGEAAGIVASGVYRHFSSKAELLEAAVARGDERMRTGLEQALGRAGGPLEILEGLLRSHISVWIEHAHLIGVLTNERNHLQDMRSRDLRRWLRDYVELWQQVLESARPGRPAAESKYVVHAVHSMIYLVVRANRPQPRADLADRLTELGMSLLLDT